MKFLDELRRRNVFRVAAAYAVVGWLLIQAADILLANFGAPDWVFRSLVALLGIGFVAAVIMAWAFELTPDGIARDTGAVTAGAAVPARRGRLDRLIVVGLLAVIAVMAVERLWFAEQSIQPASSGQDGALLPASRASVAALPFVAMSSGEDDEYFADGLTEELINALAALPELQVTARTSSFHFKGRDVPVPQIAETLGVAWIVEGSVRRSDDKLRITAQLVRASDGFHLWSRAYDREKSDVFAVQLDIAQSIAASLDVVLDARKRKLMENAGVRDVEAFIAYQKGYALYTEAHTDSSRRDEILTEANRYFRQATNRFPEFARAYLYHSDVHAHRLLDAAAGRRNPTVTTEVLADAQRQVSADLTDALRHATDADRAAIEYLRTLFADDWRTLTATVDRVHASTACLTPLYLYLMHVFRRADVAREFYERQVACNPLDLFTWVDLVPAMLWQGDPEAAIAAAREAEARIGAHHYLDYDVLMARLALRDHAGAEAMLESPALSESERDALSVALFAVRDDRAAAREAAARWLEKHGPDDARALVFAAWQGDRETANAVATLIDGRNHGPVALISATEQCRCGTPFDLSATPHLAARLEEAGLPWPPPAPVHFPLKDWPSARDNR